LIDSLCQLFLVRIKLVRDQWPPAASPVVSGVSTDARASLFTAFLAIDSLDHEKSGSMKARHTLLPQPGAFDPVTPAHGFHLNGIKTVWYCTEP
tara:strand:- start:19410 stop:19691 length:282 start_codon:yes stop_codon:yes gene_type:complete